MPSITAQFKLNWDFINASTSGNANSFGNEPTIEFTNLFLDAGDVVNNLIGPLFKDFDKIIKPVHQGLNILTDPVPVISDLVGDGFTMLRGLKLVAEAFVGP